MKLFIFAVCAIAAVRADVSHLSGHGYRYDKPSLTFDVPEPFSVAQPQISTPSNNNLLSQSDFKTSLVKPIQIHDDGNHLNKQPPTSEYLPPTTQSNGQPEISHLQYNAPSGVPVSEQLLSHADEGPSNDYLPPQTHYSNPAAAPVHTAVSTGLSHNGPPLSFLGNPQKDAEVPDISQQQGFAPASQPANDYLPPPVHYHSPGHSSVKHKDSSQPRDDVSHQQHYTSSHFGAQPYYYTSVQAPVYHQDVDNAVTLNTQPAHQHHETPQTETVHHQEISHTLAVSQPHYFAPAQKPHHHHDFPQTVSQPEYFIPATAPVHHHQEISHTVSVNQPEYAAPLQAAHHHHEHPQALYHPQYSAPAQAPVYHHQEVSHTIAVSQPKFSAPVNQHHSTPVNNYLPPQQQYNGLAEITAQAPALPQHQEVRQPFSTFSGDYLPPVEHHHAEHPQAEEQTHGHHSESQDTNEADGYHYDVPAKHFRF